MKIFFNEIGKLALFIGRVQTKLSASKTVFVLIKWQLQTLLLFVHVFPNLIQNKLSLDT